MESKPDPKLLFYRVSGRKTGPTFPGNTLAARLSLAPLGKKEMGSWNVHKGWSIRRVAISQYWRGYFRLNVL